MSEEQNQKPDALVTFILERTGDAPYPTAAELAQGFAVGRVKPKEGPQAWRRYLNPVKQQVLHLARKGAVELIRNGEVVADLEEARGRFTIRRAQAAE